MLRLLLILLFVSSNAKAEFRPTSLDHLSIDVARFGCNREPMTPDIPCTDYRGRVRVNFNLGLLNDTLKWRNEVHTEGTDAKVETVGWKYVLSLPLPGGLEPFVEHHSRHVMDREQPIISGKTKAEKFAVEDSYGLKLVIWNKGDK